MKLPASIDGISIIELIGECYSFGDCYIVIVLSTSKIELMNTVFI